MKEEVSIAAVASHSALDVFDGARDEGFKTIAICQKGRETPYKRFPVVDRIILLDRFRDMIKEEVQTELMEYGAVIVPNRSMAVYVGYDEIENSLKIPVYGNKRLLRWEDRIGEKTYYRLLDEGGIRRPKTYRDPSEVDGPVMVKMPEAARKVERGFFVASDRKRLEEKLEELKEKGVISDESIKEMVIEELVLGAHFNLNYFYSVMRNRVEFLSVDRRIQSNLAGVLRLPARDQLDINPVVRMVEVGHIAVTLRESLLEKAFRIGERFVEASKKLEPPGIIGPFTLQVIVTPELDLVVFDVATRIGGGTNVYLGIGQQYSKLYFGEAITTGRRIAMEIKEALERGELRRIVT